MYSRPPLTILEYKSILRKRSSDQSRRWRLEGSKKPVFPISHPRSRRTRRVACSFDGKTIRSSSFSQVVISASALIKHGCSPTSANAERVLTKGEIRIGSIATLIDLSDIFRITNFLRIPLKSIVLSNISSNKLGASSAQAHDNVIYS